MPNIVSAVWVAFSSSVEMMLKKYYNIYTKLKKIDKKFPCHILNCLCCYLMWLDKKNKSNIDGFEK